MDLMVTHTVQGSGESCKSCWYGVAYREVQCYRARQPHQLAREWWCVAWQRYGAAQPLSHEVHSDPKGESASCDTSA